MTSASRRPSRLRRPSTTDPDAALAWFEGLLAELGAARIGRTWQCPAHEGESPALRVSRGDRGVMAHCWAGCPLDRVLARLALRRVHLVHPPPGTPARYRLARLSGLVLPPMDTGGSGSPQERGLRFVAEHPYGSPPRAWVVRYRHPGTGVKDCRWESLNPRGERVPGLLGTPEHELGLYREHEAVAAVAFGEPVVVVESESSVDAIARTGLVATTWAGGASSPDLAGLVRVLGDHDRTLVIADHDDPGLACADRIATALPHARVHVPEVAGTDARDLLTHLGPDRFRDLIDEETS